MFTISIRIFITLLGLIACFMPSILQWWIIRELINLLAIYYLFYCSKETSASDINMYIYTMFHATLVLFSGIMLESDVIIRARVLAKLGLLTIHRPVIAICSKLNLSSILIVIIAPKLPYFLICSELPDSLFIIPRILLSLICINISPSECVRFSLVISSNALAFAFSINMESRLIAFARALIWGLLVGIVDTIKNVSIKDNYINYRYLFNIILPLPRSYSWLIKIIIFADRYPLNFYVAIFAIVFITFPFWYVLSITALNKNKFSNDPEIGTINLLIPLAFTIIIVYIFTHY